MLVPFVELLPPMEPYYILYFFAFMFIEETGSQQNRNELQIVLRLVINLRYTMTCTPLLAHENATNLANVCGSATENPVASTSLHGYGLSCALAAHLSK